MRQPRAIPKHPQRRVTPEVQGSARHDRESARTRARLKSSRLTTPQDAPTRTALPATHPLLSNPATAAALAESRARLSQSQRAGASGLDALQFLRLSEVCRLLRISKPTLWRLRRVGEFPEPTELTDRVIAWRRSEIETWLSERRTAGHGTRANASNQSAAVVTQGDERRVASVEPPRPAAPRRKTLKRETSVDQMALPLLMRP